MRKAKKKTATRQVIHIVGEGLTELFYFSHLKKLLGYRYSIGDTFNVMVTGKFRTGIHKAEE